MVDIFASIRAVELDIGALARRWQLPAKTVDKISRKPDFPAPYRTISRRRRWRLEDIERFDLAHPKLLQQADLRRGKRCGRPVEPQSWRHEDGR